MKNAVPGRNQIEPVPRQVRIVQEGPLCIAVPVEEGPALSGETVEQVRREVREDIEIVVPGRERHH